MKKFCLISILALTSMNVFAYNLKIFSSENKVNDKVDKFIKARAFESEYKAFHNNWVCFINSDEAQKYKEEIENVWRDRGIKNLELVNQVDFEKRAVDFFDNAVREVRRALLFSVIEQCIDSEQRIPLTIEWVQALRGLILGNSGSMAVEAKNAREVDRRNINGNRIDLTKILSDFFDKYKEEISAVDLYFILSAARKRIGDYSINIGISKIMLGIYKIYGYNTKEGEASKAFLVSENNVSSAWVNGEILASSNGDTSASSKGKTSASSNGDTSASSKGKTSASSNGDTSASSKGKTSASNSDSLNEVLKRVGGYYQSWADLGINAAISNYANQNVFDTGGGCEDVINRGSNASWIDKEIKKNLRGERFDYYYSTLFTDQNPDFYNSKSYKIKSSIIPYIILNCPHFAEGGYTTTNVIAYAANPDYYYSKNYANYFSELTQYINRKDLRCYHYLIMQTIGLAINNKIEKFNLGGEAGTGIFSDLFGDTTEQAKKRLKSAVIDAIRCMLPFIPTTLKIVLNTATYPLSDNL